LETEEFASEVAERCEQVGMAGTPRLGEAGEASGPRQRWLVSVGGEVFGPSALQPPPGPV
jgi:hypothetical protein